MKTSQSFEFLPPLLLRKPFFADTHVDKFSLRFSNFKTLTMPGLHGSDVDHWQSAWELRYPKFQRVEQSDWESPDIDGWAQKLIDKATGSNLPVIVVAHSFGCLATIRASILQPGLIAGALLVAPADPARFGVENTLPDSSLGFPTLIVGSTNDPFLSQLDAEQWANLWGSKIVTLTGAGHINVQSGYRNWFFGLDLLESVCNWVDCGNTACLI
jgi:hypothetical protein